MPETPENEREGLKVQCFKIDPGTNTNLQVSLLILNLYFEKARSEMKLISKALALILALLNSDSVFVSVIVNCEILVYHLHKWWIGVDVCSKRFLRLLRRVKCGYDGFLQPVNRGLLLCQINAIFVSSLLYFNFIFNKFKFCFLKSLLALDEGFSNGNLFHTSILINTES